MSLVVTRLFSRFGVNCALGRTKKLVITKRGVLSGDYSPFCFWWFPGANLPLLTQIRIANAVDEKAKKVPQKVEERRAKTLKGV